MQRECSPSIVPMTPVCHGEVKDLSVDNLRRQFAESRALLGDHLRLYQIHSATVESRVLQDDAVLTELQRIKETGLAVGLTATGSRQSETIEHALAIGVFDTVQATWNLFERSATRVLEQAHAAGVGVIIKEALANGRLTASGADGPVVLGPAACDAHRGSTNVGAVQAEPNALDEFRQLPLAQVVVSVRNAGLDTSFISVPQKLRIERLMARSITPSARAMARCCQPCCFNSRARSRRHLRHS
jgi:aryl-alcohol dehydrogenase-like predicted oxidoreductase